MGQITEVNANQAVSDNYQSYARYVLETRALPQVNDGLKLVQRRIIYGANQQPQKLMKTAALAGHIMRLHPHGDCSGAIYKMTNPCNRMKIFDIKGNHGGHSWGASAPRYTECYLNEVGRFNYCQFIDYAEYKEGELGFPEPVSLPCLIPYALIEGADGMGVGIATDVMPLNVMDLIEYYKDVIKDGYSDRLVRPDLGDFIVHDIDVNLKESINKAKCSIRINPVITREGNSIVFTTLPSGKSIDYVIRKLGWEDCIDYRNESTSVGRHVFTVVDDRKGACSVENVLDWTTYHTKSTPSFSRTMVDTSGVANYITLENVVRASLSTLNKAIDKMIQIRISEIEHKMALYNAIDLAKEHKLFNDLADKHLHELIDSMVNIGIESELAKEISRKPISYLTRDHEAEYSELNCQLQSYIDHDRTKYLLEMYDKFKSMIQDDFNSKSHTILETEMLKNPRVRLRSPSELEIYEGKRGGIRLGDACYLIKDDGYCEVMYCSAQSRKVVPLDESYIGVTTNFYKYIELQTDRDKQGVSFRTEDLKYSKNLVTLRDDEKVVNVIGWNDDAPSRVLNNLVTKRSKTRWY